MKEPIPPVDRELLRQELTEERFMRHTNFGGNHIYLVNHHNAPHTMREIGRLREISFRSAGGGTGLEIDIDDNDTCENCYDQLIAWHPEDEEIIAGYRLIECAKAGVNSNGEPNLSTLHLFKFSERFKNEYLPQTIELGRSFVQPMYQPGAGGRKGLFSLDNLWDGLGAYVLLRPEIKYLFGKVTMYPHFDKEGRDMLLYFMHRYFPDREGLVKPITPLTYHGSVMAFEKQFEGLDFQEGYKVLNAALRAKGENIPPLINTYMNLSRSMRTFGTAMNNEFGAVEETGILITIGDIYETKKGRHMDTFERDRPFRKKS